MLIYPFRKITCYANIQSAISFICHNVDIVGLGHNTGLDSRFRGNDNIFSIPPTPYGKIILNDFTTRESKLPGYETEAVTGVSPDDAMRVSIVRK